mmetsp:Transcript_31516/g.90776  ORF Transcript_31516/g.90776 Transcript_31516/m.90776 type:complete len:289 (+) Transcript_31516:888-1754(+)
MEALPQLGCINRDGTPQVVDRGLQPRHDALHLRALHGQRRQLHLRTLHRDAQLPHLCLQFEEAVRLVRPCGRAAGATQPTSRAGELLAQLRDEPVLAIEELVPQSLDGRLPHTALCVQRALRGLEDLPPQGGEVLGDVCVPCAVHGLALLQSHELLFDAGHSGQKRLLERRRLPRRSIAGDARGAASREARDGDRQQGPLPRLPRRLRPHLLAARQVPRVFAITCARRTDRARAARRGARPHGDAAHGLHEGPEGDEAGLCGVEEPEERCRVAVEAQPLQPRREALAR